MLVVKIYPSECFLYLRYENDDAGPVQTVSVFLRSYHPPYKYYNVGPEQTVSTDAIRPGCLFFCLKIFLYQYLKSTSLACKQ